MSLWHDMPICGLLFLRQLALKRFKSPYCFKTIWKCTYAPPFSIAVCRIDGVMVSVLASSVVDRGFEPLSEQT
jgi:hypothetical protein